MNKIFRKLFKKISVDEYKSKDSRKVNQERRANAEYDFSRDELITFGYLSTTTTTLQSQEHNSTASYFPIHSLISGTSSNNRSETGNNLSAVPVSVVIDSCSSSIIDFESDDSDGHDDDRKVLKLKVNQNLLSNTQTLNYCGRGLTGLNAEIFTSPCLERLEKLQLCCNSQLEELPDEICLLKRLRVLNLTGCALKKLPETIGYLQQLEELWLTKNRLSWLPASISGLQKLRKLGLAENEFRLVPRSVLLLNKKLLTCLQLDGNPHLQFVPSEIAHFSQLSRFHVDGCPRLIYRKSEAANLERKLTSSTPPSLLECSARALVRHRQPVLLALPEHLKEFLAGADWCSLCQGPMFRSRVTRYRQIKRMERIIPVLDELCCAHWQKREDADGTESFADIDAARIRCLLSSLPPSVPPNLLGELETDRFVPFNRFNPQERAIGTRILARFNDQQKCTLMVPLSMIIPYPEYPRKM